MFVEIDHSDDWLINRWSKFITDATNTPFQDKLPAITKMFNLGVDVLRDPQSTPSLPINRLMTLAWRLIGNKVVATTVAEVMPLGHPETLHFWCEIRSGQALGIVMVPFEWAKMVIEDRWMQMGGLVFIGSQVADYWHGKINRYSGDRPAMERAMAHEAEFLLTLEGFKPNSYQKQVLDHFPQGLKSLPADLRYELKPYKAEDFVKVNAGKTVEDFNG